MNISNKILSDVTVWNKYSRYISELERRETFNEVVDRYYNMMSEKYPHLQERTDKYIKYIRERKILPSMRGLQFAGKAVEKNESRIYNCAFLPIDDYRAFSETMFLLLGGTGVGYSVQERHINQLPGIKKPTSSQKFIIEDSIEGWADSIKYLLKAYFGLRRHKPRFDFSAIRPKGERLVTAGGKAPGPEPLKRCLMQIELILDRRIETGRLTTLNCHDILCHIADAVLSGGIRRAAMICLFDKNDTSMITCKSGSWWELNPQRGRANNSTVLSRKTTTKEEFNHLWSMIKASGSGEPGIYWTNNLDWGTNPCCFTGDTLVATADGRNAVSIKDLCDENYKGPVYSMQTQINQVVTSHCSNVWISRKNAKLVKVTLDDGSTFRCTPDHRIMLRNGQYMEAQKLTEGVSLMPFNSFKRTDRDYRMISSNTGRDIAQYAHVAQAYDIIKVSSIKFLEDREDVYDMTVEGTHNFAIITSKGDSNFITSSGVFVHNCEIALKPHSFCNLTEINVSEVTTDEEMEGLVLAAAYFGTLQAGFTDFHYLRSIWQQTTEEDALIGVGMTGIASGMLDKDGEPFDLPYLAARAKKMNKIIAESIGINSAARVTTVKPSGSTSCVVGSSSGIHAWHDEYYIRRMELNANEALVPYLLANYPELIKPLERRPGDYVLEFPQSAPLQAVLRNKETALQFLNRVHKFNVEWVAEGHRRGDNRNNVSATCSVREDEWDDVGEWMWKNKGIYNGMSVLPYDGGTYSQAPFETISKSRYYKMMESLAEVDLTKVIELDDATDLNQQVACGGAGGSCEII